MVKLNEFHLEDIKSSKHNSAFIQNSNYNILILKLFTLKDKKIEPFNLNLIIENNQIYHFDGDNFIKIDGYDALFEFLDPKINKILEIVAILSNKIEKLENRFYENQDLDNFNKIWFFNKSNLIKMSRVLSKADEAFKEFLKFYHSENQDLNIKFDDLLEHIQRSNKNTDYAIENLDTIYMVHSTYKDEKIQKSLYALTMLSGIFLPLNFIVGFFGINTSSLPFSSGTGGTYYVVLILIISALIFAFVLHYIDRKS
ncbi:CorA family divalent cation transporter [Campylobacter geochelonis]|uniref:CorA family divalent cation transporter n=1 Tax=Campylobacter geochelonis TaxID=1780362 RepID=UPI00077090D0|nr:CorA family divalent cation transporter [Campylobacter geochelonis]CZE50555.1 CorA-like Mg2+ transporter protein [Campylobacter geochelonis]